MAGACAVWLAVLHLLHRSRIRITTEPDPVIEQCLPQPFARSA
jgi:hypothetical protein